jgi:hypothetical protein
MKNLLPRYLCWLCCLTIYDCYDIWLDMLHILAGWLCLVRLLPSCARYGGWLAIFVSLTGYAGSAILLAMLTGSACNAG